MTNRNHLMQTAGTAIASKSPARMRKMPALPVHGFISLTISVFLCSFNISIRLTRRINRRPSKKMHRTRKSANTMPITSPPGPTRYFISAWVRISASNPFHIRKERGTASTSPPSAYRAVTIPTSTARHFPNFLFLSPRAKSTPISLLLCRKNRFAP